MVTCVSSPGSSGLVRIVCNQSALACALVQYSGLRACLDLPFASAQVAASAERACIDTRCEALLTERQLLGQRVPLRRVHAWLRVAIRELAP